MMMNANVRFHLPYGANLTLNSRIFFQEPPFVSGYTTRLVNRDQIV